MSKDLRLIFTRIIIRIIKYTKRNNLFKYILTYYKDVLEILPNYNMYQDFILITYCICYIF